MAKRKPFSTRKTMTDFLGESCGGGEYCNLFKKLVIIGKAK